MDGSVEEREALRRQVDSTLRFMRLQTAVGVVVIAVLAALLSGARGLMILIGLVFLLTSGVAYWFLRRSLVARLLKD